MKVAFRLLSGLLALVATLHGAEYQVATNGSDSNPGTKERPFRTIQHAADLAQPGDVITVRQGVYRERLRPPRGGLSDRKRIVYRAAPGETVAIKGSEVVTNWVKVQDEVWQVTIPNSFFGGFNPYDDLIRGDWFSPQGRPHHTGAVYLNGDWLLEAARLDDVLKPADKVARWFGQVDGTNTTLWAQFPGANPNEQLVEINKRQTVFYPEKTNINYLTVRGFTLEQAATPWAPPTAEQLGLIGTHWSKGWIIESNVIRYSRCSGVALGKYGDEWDNRAESAEGYLGTIHRALTNGWNRENIGHHLVRNNEISHCEQTGIVGSLGCAFSTIAGNDIHDIHVQRRFSGAEMAGIKFHGAIDVVISGNHLYRTIRGIWLDWMAQGTQVVGNLFHDNRNEDLFCEVDHGPFLVANNIFLSRQSLLVMSQGGAYAHNLFAGNIRVQKFDGRLTPFLRAHATELAGLHDNPDGDVRYYNNLFLDRANLSAYDRATLPVWMGGNVFLKGAVPCTQEKEPLLRPDFDPALKLTPAKDGGYLDIALDEAWAAEQKHPLVTTRLLGQAAIPNLPFENADGSAIRISTDYFGKHRNGDNPFPGPFEIGQGGQLRLKVW
ncbi:MAG TPA: right-handed parallel beta-helix repeat-containing protein [Candidatus Acidoferrum sp.]|nr:right-handed parallel beta-helix repeat-containing protein [Candidatus Acidoferrum sp.]